MILAINELAEKALENLYHALNQISFGVQIAPGRLVLLNNRIALHSRDTFTAEYDQNGCAYRWIQRLLVAASLWNYRHLRHVHDRVFSCEFFTEISNLPS